MPFSPYGSTPQIINLSNSGSKNMCVNGSSNAQTFSYTNTNSSPVTLNGISILLSHNGTTPFGVFGALSSSLTNGIIIQTNINGTANTLTSIKDNSDLCTRFQQNQFGSSAVLSILSIVTPEGFGNSNNVFVGFMEFPDPILLNVNDSISAIVQDNLSSVNYLQIAVSTTVLP